MYPRNIPTINHVVIMGNSTSDRGTFMKRTLFGFIPMRIIVALVMKTHNDRFTNGYTWADDMGGLLASRFLTQHFLKDHKNIADYTDIADAVITNDTHIKNEINQAYNLDNDKTIDYKHTRYFRIYAEGGLTSADYRHKFTFNPMNEVPRLVVSSLPRQRRKLLADDEITHVTEDEKSRTLVIEWSGGNDLITVNTAPDMNIALRAVNARIENMMELIKNGYRHFALITMPNLAFTPRFQAKSEQDRINAKTVSDYFNNELKRRCEELKRNLSEISIDVFDINPTFEKVIAEPEKYGFDADKTVAQFVKSEEYKKNKNKKLLPATRYIFWDDVHPSSHVHAMLAAEFYEQFSRIYRFGAPAKTCDQDLVLRGLRW